MKNAIYIRISTEEQSIDLQMQAISSFLQYKGITDTQVYQDIGFTGSNINRPALKRLLDDCKAGKVASITVWKLDRLFRSLGHLIGTLETLKHSNVLFYSVTEAIDLSTPAGQLMMHLIGAFAQFERSIIVERVNAGLKAAKAKGIKLGRRIEITETRRAEIVELYNTQGYTMKRIVLEQRISMGSVHKIIQEAKSNTIDLKKTV